MKNISATEEREIIFIQYDLPPLKSAEYTITLKQRTNQQATEFSTSRKFAVTSERFSLNQDDINSNFPQNLANGEFANVLPHVLFNRRILPWERSSVADEADAPWLAVLLFNEDEQPPVIQLKANALVPAGKTITVAGSSITGVGAMPSGIFSYPGLDHLDYGETPDDACNIIDISADMFNRIAPTKKDLPFLAHIRKMQTLDKADNIAKELENYTVVLGNRLPLRDTTSYAYLVSLENMGDYLPDENSTSHLPEGISTVRLLCYLSWSYTANDDDESFKRLLENLNKDALGQQGLTVLQVPFYGAAPDTQAIKSALEKQHNGTLTPVDANILVQNALLMGYTPHDHYLRHSGHTVSWYRGPLLPYLVKESFIAPTTCPDAVNCYNPETGLFDVSYGAAWQLGQLLALQNKAFASAMYNWKKSLYAWQAKEAEQEIIEDKYTGITAFAEVFAKRRAWIEVGIDPPEEIVKWMAKLSLLHGVPFNYLVADERMLPPESLRFFYMDNNWVDALMDGAFSIGRSTTASLLVEEPHFQELSRNARVMATQFRLRKASLKNYVNTSKIITGCLLRSAVLKGWPGLEIIGYDSDGGEINKLRMAALSEEVMICIFDGVLAKLSLHEPPEALHSGVEGTYPDLFTSLRVVQGGGDPGSQIPDLVATISARPDAQTLQIAQAAGTIKTVLNNPPLNEGITDFTAAQFALEMIKGVVKVDFINKS
ncbi:hypothetical protein ACDQ55_18595 [Chitinophaga sp. 30R24]|uniref:hypothetical protein n=1 Tax=Chitinophaga sp. 30R24 TaxID=3248838 RepID=UPI003B9109F5